MNPAVSRSASRVCLNTRALNILPSSSRCASTNSKNTGGTATYKPLAAVARLQPQKPTFRRSNRDPRREHSAADGYRDNNNASTQKARKPRPPTVPETIAPQLSQEEVTEVFAQELFVFRCDVTATQIAAAMTSYNQLSELGVLTTNDISNLARQMHARWRVDGVKEEILPHVKTLIADLKDGKVVGHPLASVHLLSLLKDMEEYAIANEFWQWLVNQDESHCDARTYGAAIECLAYQGIGLSNLEALYEQAIERFSGTTVPSIAMNTGRGLPTMLLQGIITARLFHGNWKGAYEAFDICTRLYPTLTPPRIYELFIYERPIKEAYIVFLMACRAGVPPKPGVLTPLLKEVWLKTRDIRAMIRLVYAFVGAGGTPNAYHLNTLIGGVLGSFPKEMKQDHPEYKPLYEASMAIVRNLIWAFNRMRVPLAAGSFNTIISIGGKLKRQELVQSGLRELIQAGLRPTIVTYRTLVNSAGEIQDPALVENSWSILKKGRLELGARWEMLDWKALAKACVMMGREDYFFKELEAHKYELEPVFVNNIRGMMRRTIDAASLNPQSEQPEPRSSREGLENEVRQLTEIFSSNQILDFASTRESLFDLLPSEDTPEGVSLAPEQEKELKEIYQKLSMATSWNDVETNSGTRTATGYDVESLRFENWKTVNRLLFEAEWYERQLEQQKLEATRKATKDLIVKKESHKEKNIGYEFWFWNEDRAKARIRGEVVEVVKERKTGNEGWKKKEMNVRGRLGVTKTAARKTAEQEQAEKRAARENPAQEKRLTQKKLAQHKKLLEEVEKLAQRKVADEEPAESVVEEKPVEEIPAEAKTVEEKPVEEIPAEAKTVEEKPVEEIPAEAKTVEEKPVEEIPAEAKTVEEKPVEEIPAEAKTVEETNVVVEEEVVLVEEVKPVEKTTADDSPAEKPAAREEKEVRKA
jgi:hypothetical protein